MIATVFVGTKANISFGYIFVFILVIGISSFIFLNYSLKALSIPVIKELDHDEYEKIFNSLPFEIQAIEKLGFTIFNKFHYNLPSIRMSILFFKGTEKGIYFGIYIYGNNRYLTFLMTSFKGKAELVTSNSKLIAKLPRDKTDYYQYFGGISNTELFKRHNDSISYLKNKYNFVIKEFREPSDLKSNFIKEQNDKYKRLAPFVFYKLIKFQLKNDINEIAMPIEEQLRLVENSK